MSLRESEQSNFILVHNEFFLNSVVICRYVANKNGTFNNKHLPMVNGFVEK